MAPLEKREAKLEPYFSYKISDKFSHPPLSTEEERLKSATYFYLHQEIRHPLILNLYTAHGIELQGLHCA